MRHEVSRSFRLKKYAEVLQFPTHQDCRENARQKEMILAPFQEKICAKSKNFWRELLRKTGAIFRPFLPHNFEKYAP